MKVTFRVFPENDVIALFPSEVWDHKGNIMSYQRIGQHGGASDNLLNELQKATPEEYASLYDELVKRGYDNLEVIA